jgi:hypothetical protein
MTLGTVTLVGIVVVAVLIWFFMRTRTQDLLSQMMEKRRGTSKLVSRADYVEGMEHMPVALALTDNMFYYENSDLQALFELDRIDEVEYDDELATGRTLEQGQRALRLRSHGTTFDFVMTDADAQKWMAALPARRQGDAARAM